MEMQRQRARQARDMDNIGWTNKEDEHLYENIESQFVGYESEKTQSQIIKIIKDNEEVEELSQGKAVILLDKTPFYGESGGQIGDTGLIKGKDFIFKVLDTKKTSKGIHIQIGEVESGIVKKGSVEALVDSQRRRNPDDTKVPTVDEDNKPIDKTQYDIVAFKVTDADKTKGSLTLGKDCFYIN